MKLAIVSPEFPFSGKVPLVPPILEYLAALTLRVVPDSEIQLVDANQTPISPAGIAAQLVAISVMTATAPWAYRFADECRRAGKTVVLGGIHPSALPEEAALHADAVVVGEAESVWGQVLHDARSGRLQKFYRGERQALNALPQPIDGKLKGNYQFRAFFTMRGCPYRCTFCSVRRFFGDTIRYRPIDEVACEIESRAGKLWFNGDDNIWGGDFQRSIDLFEELARGSKRHWYGFGDLRSIQGEQGARMLAAARRSGLFSVWVGWEGEEQHLGSFNASGKQGANREAAVKQMQDAGIDVTLFVVLGGRQDSIDSFKRTLELSERLQVGIHPVLLTPLPGTELYEEYREHLLPGLGWESFTGVNAVFRHPDPVMTPLRREEEYHRLANELFRFERIAARVGKISSKGFPSTHLYSFMMQVPMKHALSKAYEEWKFSAGNLAEESVEGALTSPPLRRGDRGGLPFRLSRPIPSTSAVSERYLGAGHFPAIVVMLAIMAFHLLRGNALAPSVADLAARVLFLAWFPVVALALIRNRKTAYRYLDTLIDWTRDGRSRRKLIRGQALVALGYLAALYWGYLCAFVL